MTPSTHARVEAFGAAGRPGAAARVLSSVIYYALLALLPLAAAPYGSVEPWWTAFFGAAIFALGALWAVEGALAGRWLTRAHLLTLPALALAALALLQSLPLPGFGVVSFDPYESRVFALRLLAVTLYAALLLRHAATERRLRALAVTVVCVGAASALFGIFRQAAQREELGFFLPLLRKGEGFAQFVSRNHFPYLAEMALGLALGLVVARGVTRPKALLCAAAAIPLWVGLVLSNSRGGVFAMLCQMLFLAATFGATRTARKAGGREMLTAGPRRSRALRVAFAAVLLAAVVAGTVWVGGDPLADRVGAVRDEAGRADTMRAGRAGIWEDTWRLVERHPLAGVGLGGYWVAIRSTHTGSGELVPRQAHNDYLELLASSGVVGALLLLTFLFLLVRLARERLRGGTPFTRAVCLGALAGLFGAAVHSLVDFGLHVTANAFVFAALVALAAARVGDGGDTLDGRGRVQKTSRQEY
ncbi:MAG TPA: O-antigen ligase family protein [Pyrinomonadaceae bacterium]